ncbi:P-II family nitrogen regulator [Candidatus Sumerlaeota bacterium]|nr:P-II family nitrogen regulator [Candidatus Sumerlaeota bacterium]
MKMIRAIIQPHRVDAVRDALQEEGILGMTTYQAQGFGRQRGHKEIYRGAEYQISFRPKITIDIVLDEKQVKGAVEAIIRASRSGNIGDGKIFILPVDEAVRIRTGESGEQAL